MTRCKAHAHPLRHRTCASRYRARRDRGIGTSSPCKSSTALNPPQSRPPATCSLPALSPDFASDFFPSPPTLAAFAADLGSGLEEGTLRAAASLREQYRHVAYGLPRRPAGNLCVASATQDQHLGRCEASSVSQEGECCHRKRLPKGACLWHASRPMRRHKFRVQSHSLRSARNQDARTRLRRKCQDS